MEERKITRVQFALQLGEVPEFQRKQRVAAYARVSTSSTEQLRYLQQSLDSEASAGKIKKSRLSSAQYRKRKSGCNSNQLHPLDM